MPNDMKLIYYGQNLCQESVMSKLFGEFVGTIIKNKYEYNTGPSSMEVSKK